MGMTPVDLYRSGNSTSPNLDRVRITGHDPDVDTYTGAAGKIVVEANGKGVSTATAPDPDWSGTPWRLPKGSPYPDTLFVWSDEPGHYLWAPAADMPLENFKADLHTASKGFVKVSP